jgi:DNA-binding transcriptional LysR family regulator
VVAEERSFTKAAQRLHLSQPPLSRHVRQLEDELGVTLFVRHRDGIELTGEGRLLLEKARAANLAVADFQDTARAVRPSCTRPLKIGIGWGLWGAVDRIRAHHVTRWPDARIVAEDLCPERQLARERSFDVAVLRPPVDHARYESEWLFEERFVVILSDTHPLATRQALRLADLAAEPMLMYERSIGPGVYDKTLALYRAASTRPRLVEAQPPPYSQAAMMLVACRQGFYVGIASPYTQTHRASGVAIVPLNEPTALLEVRLAWPKGDISKDAREFLRSARDVFPLKRHVPRSGAA